MKFAGLVVAAAVVIAANVVALVSAARNRAAGPDAVIELTERELRLEYKSEENSANSVRLSYGPNYPHPSDWLDKNQLAELGFSRTAPDRQLPRHAYVAFEYDGPAWQKWIAGTARTDPVAAGAPHLFPIDTARTGGELRRRNPDRFHVLILPCAIDAHGYIRQVLPGSISVPPRFQAVFSAVKSRVDRPRYALKLAVGRNYEPYVIGARVLP